MGENKSTAIVAAEVSKNRFQLLWGVIVSQTPLVFKFLSVPFFVAYPPPVGGKKPIQHLGLPDMQEFQLRLSATKLFQLNPCGVGTCAGRPLKHGRLL